jgi:type I restriction enzyme M protein
MMANERFVLPKSASTCAVRIAMSRETVSVLIRLCTIEEANGTKLKDAGKSVFQDISFNTDRQVKKTEEHHSASVAGRLRR